MSGKVRIGMRKGTVSEDVSIEHEPDSPRDGAPSEQVFRKIIQEEIKGALSRSDSREAKEAKQFSLSARAAFQIAAAEIAGLTFLALMYYNFQMISGYFTPFFWALFLSIVLRGIKTKLFTGFADFKRIEKDKNIKYQLFGVQKAKFKQVWKSSFAKPIFIFAFVAIACKCLCVMFTWGCWVPWMYLVVVMIAVSLVLSVIFSFASSSSIDNLLSLVIVIGFFVVTILFVSLFVFKAVTETGEFITGMQPIVEATIKDPKWAQTISDLGINNETIPTLIDTSRVYATEWLEKEGYNVTEILEKLEQFAGDHDLDTVSEGIEGVDSSAVAVSTGSGINLSSKQIDVILNNLYALDFAETYSKITSYADWTSVVVAMGSSVLGATQAIAVYLASVVDQSLNSFIFIGALMFFVGWEVDAVDTLFKLLPVSPRKQLEISSRVKQSISQLFLVSLLLCVFRGAVTWVYFTIMGIGFSYSAAFMTAPTAIFPLISPWLLFVPAIFTTYLQNDPYWLYYAIGIAVSEFLLIGNIEENIHSLMPDSSTYLTGLGLVLGVSTFGIEGILIGPLLIVLLKTCYNVFQEQISYSDFTNEPAEESQKAKAK